MFHLQGREFPMRLSAFGDLGYACSSTDLVIQRNLNRFCSPPQLISRNWILNVLALDREADHACRAVCSLVQIDPICGRCQ